MIGKKVLTKIVLLLIVLFGVTILTFVYTNLSWSFICQQKRRFSG